jgi:hypothetical protein
MKLIRLACATGIILVSGGCAPDVVTAPAPVRVAREPSSPITRLREALAGRAPGVTMRQGAADGSVRVTIHEDWSLPLQPEPLYVIDGVPLSHAGVVAGIDPARIVDIRVMKASAAVQTYGPSGKNGALLITLKPTL